MKRKNFLTLSAIAPLALGALPTVSRAQRGSLSRLLGDDERIRPTLKRGGAADIKEMDSDKVDRFDLSSLSSSERQLAMKIAEAGTALLVKVLLHRKDPSGYPLSSDPRSLERLADSALGEFSPKIRARLEKNVLETPRLRKGLGSLNGLDLKKELTPSALRLPGAILKRGSLGPEKLGAEEPSSLSRRFCAPEMQGPNRVDLILRRLQCVDETNPESGDDDMVLGGLLIGASGNIAKMRGVVCGQFDDGDVTNFGELLLGTCSLNSTSGYPKTFYGIFQLVESDSDDAEVAAAVTAALKWIGVMAASMFAGAAVGTMVGGLIGMVGNFIGSFIDEDYFPPYGIRLTLNQPGNSYGSAYTTYTTQGIRGHDGIYRIRYSWHLTRG